MLRFVVKDLAPAIATVVAALASYVLGRMKSRDVRARLTADVELLRKLDGEPAIQAIMRDSVRLSVAHHAVLEEERIKDHSLMRFWTVTVVGVLAAAVLFQATDQFDLGEFRAIAFGLAICFSVLVGGLWIGRIAYGIQDRRLQRKADVTEQSK